MHHSNKVQIVNREKYAEFTAGSNDNGKRADRIIRQFIREQALSGIYKAFRKGLIWINDKKASPQMKVSTGDNIYIYKSLIQLKEDTSKRSPSNTDEIKKQIVYENDKILAINKKRGQLVHGEKGSLEELVRAYLENRISASLSFKPGPLHRLDRNTSGLVFFSKSIDGAREFSLELQNKTFSKYYLALIDGKLKSKEQWVDELSRDKEKRKSYIAEDQGKQAISTAIPLIQSREYSLIMIKIDTGRTHQIRVQASAHFHPLSGDRKYGGSELKGGYFLHSLTIRSQKENSLLNKDKIIASIDKESLKRLNRVLSGCNIEELENRISSIMEDI